MEEGNYQEYLVDQINRLTAELDEAKKDSVRKHNLLEDVVNELDLSSEAIEKHGPLGTPPSELVRLVLDQKDRENRMLKAGMVDLRAAIEAKDERLKEMTDCTYIEDAELAVIKKALRIAAGELSTYGDYTTKPPYEVYDNLLAAAAIEAGEQREDTLTKEGE